MARPRKLPAGMQLRGKTYYSNFRKNGKQVRKRLSSDFGTAKELLNELKSRADKADFNLLDNDYSLDELKRDYLKHCDQTLRPKTVKRYRENLKAILDALPASKVCHITAPIVTAYRDERLSQKDDNDNQLVYARTVNMEVGALSTMLNWGVKHELIGSNPLAKVRPLAVDEKRKVRRPLTVEEVTALFDESPDYLRSVWRMFATTGIRHDELVNMQFADVDHERRCVTVHAKNNKSHKAREIPLDDAALAMIAQLERDAPQRAPGEALTAEDTERIRKNFSREHVFVTPAGTPWRNNLLREFYKCAKRADIEGAERCGSVDIHSLRVTFTTLSIDHGASPKAIQDILGHSTLQMTMGVYAKATERAKREAISVLPFAKASAPDHVVSMPNVHKARPTNSNSTQNQEQQRVAIAN